MPTVIAVVGGKKSGKTTTIELLIRALAQRGIKVAAVKHISESNFTIDRVGKDTWKYTQSGAKTVIAVSSNEIATIEKIKLEELSLEGILQRCGNCDLVLLEGFRSIVAKNKNIYKIVVAKSLNEAEQSIELFDPILAFTGPHMVHSKGKKIPRFDASVVPEKLADLIQKTMKEMGPT